MVTFGPSWIFQDDLCFKVSLLVTLIPPVKSLHSSISVSVWRDNQGPGGDAGASLPFCSVPGVGPSTALPTLGEETAGSGRGRALGEPGFQGELLPECSPYTDQGDSTGSPGCPW